MPTHTYGYQLGNPVKIVATMQIKILHSKGIKSQKWYPVKNIRKNIYGVACRSTIPQTFSTYDFTSTHTIICNDCLFQISKRMNSSFNYFSLLITSGHEVG